MPDFGHASLFEPEAIGEPGNRTFRLRVQTDEQAASLWLEKEQLAALALAIRELLEQAPESLQEAEPKAIMPAGFPAQPDVEFKIGRLGLGYDERNKMVVLFIHTTEEEDDAPPSFSCRATFGQCQRFAARAEEIIASGRPICQACAMPINADGHQCGRRNGHESLPISLA